MLLYVERRCGAVRVGASGQDEFEAWPASPCEQRADRRWAAASISGRLSRISLARLPGSRAIQVFAGSRAFSRSELFAGDGGQRQVGEGVADKFGLNAALAIELLFEWEDDQHAVDVFLDELDAVLLPGPELWADEEEDGDAEAVQLLGELEVDVGEVDEDGEHGAAVADGRA